MIGIGIAKHHHVARAQDYREIELGSTCLFNNNHEGFRTFINWINQIKESCGMESVITRMKPTGHYWLNLHILKEQQIKLVTVKHSKELNDNSPTKNNVKDAKVIAQLVKDCRYVEPTISYISCT
ncbi:IS110 family transposase (plasmid) [Niallia taxi]|uniref:IS110 family transposase n=1 Tax=Niallia taxi TaxID=2499688 RepID=UPI00293425F8|nr:transposase [Niallia taxi]WOD65210.1 IS110 family transposase [Niallia taxi]